MIYRWRSGSATKNEVVRDAAQRMRETGFGLKAATITPEKAGDVGSPNAILRKALDGTVILRTGRRIPGIIPVGGVYSPISVVRMAVDDAYGAEEHREGTAWTNMLIAPKRSAVVCAAPSPSSRFNTRNVPMPRSFGGPKYTVSPIYEGMLKEEMDAAAARHAAVRYSPQLIDATYALLLTASGAEATGHPGSESRRRLLYPTS